MTAEVTVQDGFFIAAGLDRLRAEMTAALDGHPAEMRDGQILVPIEVVRMAYLRATQAATFIRLMLEADTAKRHAILSSDNVVLFHPRTGATA